MCRCFSAALSIPISPSTLSKPRLLHVPKNQLKTPKPTTTQSHGQLPQVRPTRTGGGKLKLKSPKQVTPQLNWVISRAGLKRTYQHKYFDDLSSEIPPLPLQGHKQNWITGKTFWSEVRQQENALFLGVLTIKALQGKNIYKQNWDKISMFSRIFKIFFF